MNLKLSVKLSDRNINFLKRISINEAYANNNLKPMTPSKAIDLIEKYFKLNNQEYKDMIALGEDNESK